MPSETEEKTFSSVLIEAMRMKNMSLEKLTLATGISDRFLGHLMNDELEKLPAAPYTHGYLVKIADALGVDGEELWKEYLLRASSVRRSGKNDHLPPNRFVTPQFNRKAVAWGALLLVLAVFVVLRLPAFRGTPNFTIDLPDNFIATTSTLVIKGTMNPADQLTIDKEVVYPQNDGSFQKTVTLESNKFNPFNFTFKRFLGREVTVTKQVFYEAPTSSQHGTTTQETP